MFQLEPLERLISICLYSAYVKERKPLSLIIVADPASGKTEVLKKFINNKNVHTIDSTTRFGITKILLEAEAKHEEINHFIIPDLCSIITGSPQSANDTINTLNSLTEEGIKEVKTYYIPLTFSQPKKAGVLTAVTPKILQDKRTRLSDIGFLSRFIVFSYSYDKEIVQKILDFIEEGTILKEKEIILDLPKEKQEVTCEAKYVHEFRSFADPKIFKGTLSIRFLEHIRIMLKSVALINGRTEVTQEDVKLLMPIIAYLNLNYKPITGDFVEAKE